MSLIAIAFLGESNFKAFAVSAGHIFHPAHIHIAFTIILIISDDSPSVKITFHEGFIIIDLEIKLRDKILCCDFSITQRLYIINIQLELVFNVFYSFFTES